MEAVTGQEHRYPIHTVQKVQILQFKSYVGLHCHWALLLVDCQTSVNLTWFTTSQFGSILLTSNTCMTVQYNDICIIFSLKLYIMKKKIENVS